MSLTHRFAYLAILSWAPLLGLGLARGVPVVGWVCIALGAFLLCLAASDLCHWAHNTFRPRWRRGAFLRPGRRV